MESLNAAKIIEECKMSGEAVAEIVASHGEDNFIHVSDIEEFASNHDRLVEENATLREALQGALSMKRLWLPQGSFSDNPPENYQEIEALHLMAKSFEQLLNK